MSKILEIAEKELGYVEENGNKTKYGKWFDLDGVKWCGIFVSWCYAMAGLELTKVQFLRGFAGCDYFYHYAKKKGWIVTDPKEGDIVLYDWNGDGRFDHTGLYHSKYSNKKFNAIEGNTSLANQSNGGQVMKRLRIKNNGVVFVRPNIANIIS